ncbi:bone morphogenetic protein receptor type-1B-like [Tetranychus urticae]|uniref:receptor protein serine/threonine kinase n=1 Tax=Tetranychus urticae TaxID=32264 RepID=T1JV68_TETUR|nr:bone morphogenetic protein receptor type-1B-like [Tetranychus urticae]
MELLRDKLRCFCSENVCSDYHVNNTCLVDSNGYCFTSLNKDEIFHGCFPPEESGLMQCKGHILSQRPSTLCCNDKDFCNLHLEPNSTTFTEDTEANNYYYSYYLIFLCVIFFVIFIIVLYVSKRFSKSITRNGQKYKTKLKLINSLKSFEFSSSYCDEATTGEALSIFRVSRLADHIEFKSKLDSGSFSRTWLVSWRDQPFACRVYNKMEESLWKHETLIQKPLKNPDVVGLIAKDIGEDAVTGSSRFLLLTDFFQHGSLYHFLKFKEINTDLMVSLMHSIAHGMSYLHNEILGNPPKPSIVHYNIKSRNIFVSPCGTRCLIGDFSYACAYLNDCMITQPPTFANPNPESLRYRAPESLISCDYQNNEKSGKACDIYSLSLVFWEIVSRCKPSEADYSFVVPVHKLPYDEELLGQTPSHQKMYEIIYLKRNRPKLNYFSKSPIISKVNNIIKDSWHHQATSRLTILRILKNLESLQFVDDPVKNKIKDLIV